MTVLATYLYGEVPSAPILMMLALVVAFLGSVGVGIYVFRHTPDRFQSAHDVEESKPASPRHAA